MKLTPMTDFVIIQNIRLANKEINHNECGLSILKYAHFLKQPLTIGMFVPCCEDGNVLEEPLNYNEWCKKALNTSYDLNLSKYEQYQKAKECVLFEFFDIPRDIIGLDRFKRWLKLKDTVEQLVKSNLTLTSSALKQIGL